jgi:hypothetical protein
VLVLAEELPGPCTLDSVQLLCGSDVYNHGVFLDARVLACHTTVTELDSVCKDNYAGNTPDTVMLHDTLSLSWTNGEWQTLGFEHRFGYNGSDNLILEFLWQGDDGGSVYNLGYYTPGNRAVDARPSTAERGVPRNYMPRLRIHYSTAGVAEGRVTFPANSVTLTATPNPFRSGVTMRADGNLSLEASVYSSAGELVRRIVESASELSWDGRDGDGRRVRAGTYFCRIRNGGQFRTVHLVLRD